MLTEFALDLGPRREKTSVLHFRESRFRCHRPIPINLRARAGVNIVDKIQLDSRLRGYSEVSQRYGRGGYLPVCPSLYQVATLSESSIPLIHFFRGAIGR